MSILNTKEILERIDNAVASSGMTREEFYARSGISSASYSQWNTGVHRPTKKKLAAAADALGVTLESLLYSEEKEKPSVPKDEELTYSDMELLDAIRRADARDLKAIRVILGIE